MVMAPACLVLPEPLPPGLAARALFQSLIPVQKIADTAGIPLGLEPWVFRLVFSKLNPRLAANLEQAREKEPPRPPEQPKPHLKHYETSLRLFPEASDLPELSVLTMTSIITLS